MIERNEKFEIIQENNSMGKTFVNPLGDCGHADPCIVYCEKEKCYYGISTDGEAFWGTDKLVLHRSENFEDMFVNSESCVAYQSNAEDDTYGYLWAPELYFIQGKWYVYTSCQNSAEDNNKHIIVLEPKTDSLFDGFKISGHINRDVYAIDPSVYFDEQTEELYLCCSAVIDGEQMLSIQKLKTPTEPIGEIVIITKAELEWELVPPYDKCRIVEGGYFVKSPNGRLFIVYSANGCWSDDYVLGVLEFKGDDMLNPDCWEKYPLPVLKKSNGNFGPGHATFFYSPDKSELWVCHHCLEASDPENKPMKRRCHCQRVYFDETGFIHIGDLVKCGIPYPIPSAKEN